jgi:hypothetical protein
MVGAICLLSDSAHYSRWGMLTLGDGKEQSVGEVSYKIHTRNTLAALCRRGPDSTKCASEILVPKLVKVVNI